jgi:thiamine pyrophosphate-dependent acetolactate synthase large subunit-like protein
MSGVNSLDRRKAVAELLSERGDALVVTGLGSSTYDVSAAGDTDRNFYLWGAMGGAAMIGLGLAIARPGVPVIVMTGDGEMLMGLGSLATIAQQQARNLSIVVLDNGLYGETGRQASHTARGTDIAEVARACGIAQAVTVRSMDEIAALKCDIQKADRGPRLAVVKISDAEHPRVVALRDGAHGRARTRRALGLPAD